MTFIRTTSRHFNERKPPMLRIDVSVSLHATWPITIADHRGAIGPEALTFRQAWLYYNLLTDAWHMELLGERIGLDTAFRRHTDVASVSPRLWADGYLAAFAEVRGLRLVTFDKFLAAKAKGSILLKALFDLSSQHCASRRAHVAV